MRKFKHLIFDERNLFKDLLLYDTWKKKNSTINLSEISRQTSRGVNTVKREIKQFKNIQDYNPYQAQKDYKQKRKKCIKKLPKFTK